MKLISLQIIQCTCRQKESRVSFFIYPTTTTQRLQYKIYPTTKTNIKLSIGNWNIHKYTNTASVPIDPTYVIFLKSTLYEKLEDNIYMYCINAAISLKIYFSWIYELLLNISCQHLEDECELESFCAPFGRRVGKLTYFEI